MFEVLFVDSKSDRVVYGINDVLMLTYITVSEVGVVYENGRTGVIPFLNADHIEVRRVA